jgi:hypothetical protein
VVAGQAAVAITDAYCASILKQELPLPGLKFPPLPGDQIAKFQIADPHAQ